MTNYRTTGPGRRGGDVLLDVDFLLLGLLLLYVFLQQKVHRGNERRKDHNTRKKRKESREDNTKVWVGDERLRGWRRCRPPGSRSSCSPCAPSSPRPWPSSAPSSPSPCRASSSSSPFLNNHRPFDFAAPLFPCSTEVRSSEMHFASAHIKVNLCKPKPGRPKPNPSHCCRLVVTVRLGHYAA